MGQTIDPRSPLSSLLAWNGLTQLGAVYSEAHTLEWTQRIQLGDKPFGEIRIGLSTILVRQALDRSLSPAALAAGIALIVAIIVAMLLAQVVLRPIHVIQSGLVRLGRGELGAPLDLRDEEFRDLGDIFERVSSQLRAAGSGRLQPKQLAELSRSLVALGRLMAGVAHDVKNPLNAMTIHLQLLQQKLHDPAAAQVHVDVIAQQIAHLDEVIQGFLKWVRPDEVSFAAAGRLPLPARGLDAPLA